MLEYIIIVIISIIKNNYCYFITLNINLHIILL